LVIEFVLVARERLFQPGIRSERPLEGLAILKTNAEVL